MVNTPWIAGVLVSWLTLSVPCATALEDTELPLTAGYEKNSTNGFFMGSKDGQFRLNIGLYAQARYDVNWRETPAGEDDV